MEKISKTNQMGWQRKEEDYKQEINVLKSQTSTL